MLKRVIKSLALLAVLVPLTAACDARRGAPVEEGAQPGAAADTALAPEGSESRNPTARIFSREPEFQEVTVPAGTVLPLELQTTVASDASRVEEPVRARLRRPVVVGRMEAIPAGAQLTGAVTHAKRSARVKGRAEIAFRLTSLDIFYRFSRET